MTCRNCENPASEAWRHKANRLIQAMSFKAWHDANHDKRGRRYKRHRPYVIPAEAEALVECLGMHDQVAAEHRAKDMFLTNYRILQVTKGAPDA